MSVVAQLSSYQRAQRTVDPNLLGQHVATLPTMVPELESCPSNHYYAAVGHVDYAAEVPNCQGQSPNSLMADRFDARELLKGGHDANQAGILPYGVLKHSSDAMHLSGPNYLH